MEMDVIVSEKLKLDGDVLMEIQQLMISAGLLFHILLTILFSQIMGL